VKIYNEEHPDERCKRRSSAGRTRSTLAPAHVERQNLTISMFTRLTNGFSKKLENYIAAISLHFMNYNFCRIHQTLRVTPAMAAGVVAEPFEVSDIVRIMEQFEAEAVANRKTDRQSAAIGTGMLVASFQCWREEGSVNHERQTHQVGARPTGNSGKVRR